MPTPLASPRTRLTSHSYKFNSFTDCVRHTYKTEGFHGFYRGVWSPLASITLVRTVSFSIYQRTKYALDNWIYQTTGSSPLVIANTRGAWPTLSTVACFGLAGVNAGAAITIIACTSVSSYTHVQLADPDCRSFRTDQVERPNLRVDGRTQRRRRQERGYTEELPEFGNLEDGTESNQAPGMGRAVLWVPFAST